MRYARFKDFGTQINIEEVGDPKEVDLTENIILWESDVQGVAEFLKNKKGLLVDLRTTDSRLEAVFKDPEGRPWLIRAKPKEVR